jgi:hypothetical protein
MGSYNPAFTNGWWSLYLSPDGTQLLFSTATNGGGMTNLTATISWYSNEWYQIALTYSPTGSSLYVDGQLLANGAGVTDCPNAGELANGFRIGSDQDGTNQAGGAFDELETFNYPLAAANTATYSSEIPDWWEVKYFGCTGLNPDSELAGESTSLLNYYQSGYDPNVINFSLSATSRYVNNSTVPMRISVFRGEPAFMAVVANTNNLAVIPSQQFDINSNFTNVTWQPYNANVVASLNSGDGNYNVWIGLRGIPPDGQITWEGTQITLDTVPPILTITNPAAGTVSKPVIQLQGCANEFLSSLTYDVSNADGIWTNQTGYTTGQFYDTNLTAFTINWFQCYNVALTTNGVNLITLHAADLAGNTTTTNIAVTFDASADTNPPVLTVLWPLDGAQISGSSFTLQAQVDDPMLTVSASIVDANNNTNTAQGLVEQSGLVWVQNLPLANGANMLTVTATDAAGNTTVTNLALFQSTIIVTMNPLAGDQLNQSSVSVSGTVSDSSYTVTVNGVTATVNSDGTWEADNVPASSSGTAIFDVEVYSGGAPNFVGANLRFAPMDDPSGGNEGSQLFAMTLPVKVGLMSYLSNNSGQGFLPQKGEYPWIGSGAYPFWNSADSINWTYQSGGSDIGYEFNSGEWNWGSTFEQAPVDKSWDNQLGTNYNVLWENASMSGPDGNTEVEEDTHTYVMIEPQGQVAAGTTVTYLVQAQAWNIISSSPTVRDPFPLDSLKIQGVPLTPGGEMILQAPAGANVDVTPMGSGNYYFNVQAYQLGQLLAVDNNRDGQITFDAADATTPAKPFRFWINDSMERGDMVSGAEYQIPGEPSFGEDDNDDDIPYANYANNQIQGCSDSVNFFPVALCLSNVLQLLPPSSGYEYHLYQADSASIGGAVKFVYTSLTPTNAFDYLTNTASFGYGASFDEAAMNADTIPVNHDVTLDANFLAYIQNNGGMGVILVEGCAATPHPLMLEIWRNGKLLAGSPLYLSLSGVEQMYRHKNLRDGADAPSGLTGDLTVRDNDPSLPIQMSEPANYPDSLYNQWFFDERWFIFVVGSNVGGQNARGWESEVFKRMYWSGNKAKFVGVSWYGDPYLNNEGVYDYHMAVRNAFATAPSLASFVNGLSGNKTIAGHSLGCGLIASAIADAGMNVNNACLMDAAFAQECFDGNANDNLTAMQPSAWQGYDFGLLAANWHEQFDASDARSTLTWRNRFTNAISKVYNFYSSTEDALGEYDGDVPGSANGNQIVNSLDALIISHGNVEAYVWAYQEKAKGAQVDYYVPVMPGYFHVGSRYGGWGFNLNDALLTTYTNWYVVDYATPARRVKTPSEIGTVTMDLLNSSKYSPLFKTGWGTYDLERPWNVVINTLIHEGPDWIFDLYGITSGNTIAADPVKRNQLLAEAIPALSKPVGANRATALNNNQFNMATQFADSAHWPRGPKIGTDIPDWHHSDMDQIAYQYLYKLYNQLVSNSNQ